MRILSIHNSADIYGASRCLERLAVELKNDGHQLFTVLPCRGPLVELLERAGATVIFHPALAIVERNKMKSVWSRVSFLLRIPVSAVWLAALAVRLRVDVVHTNVATIISSPFAAIMSGRPHVWHIRECFLEFPALWKYYQYLIYYTSAIVVAMSMTVRDQFAPSIRKRIAIVYDGLPVGEFSPCAPEVIEDFRNRFGIQARSAAVLGRIKWHRKGQEVFVRAAARLKDKYPDARFLIVGSAAPGNEEHETNLKELVAQLGVGEQIVFTGEIDDVRPVLASVDSVVVPSVQPEPFGMVVTESMAMSTPVIGSRSGGIAEQVTDGNEGYLFEPGNDAELAVALDRMFSDDGRRREMGLGARRTFLDRFEIGESYRQFMEIAGPLERHPGRPVRVT